MKVLGYCVTDWVLIRGFVLKRHIIKYLQVKAYSFNINPYFNKSKSLVLPIANRPFCMWQIAVLGVVNRPFYIVQIDRFATPKTAIYHT